MTTSLPMIDKLGKFLALPADDKQELAAAALWLPLTHIKLKQSGLQSCLRSVGAGSAAPGAQEAFDAGQYERACRCERSVALASHHGLLAGTCLSRSLTLMRLLARRGIAGRLRIGVKLGGGALDAHAWVEVGGVPLGQGEHDYETFPPI